MNDNNSSSNLALADEAQEVAHMVALAGDEAYWDYLDEVDLRLESLEAESDYLPEEF